VLSYRDYFNQYRNHPEAKMLGPDGRPCHTWTRGQLAPRHVRSQVPLKRIGKDEAGEAELLEAVRRLNDAEEEVGRRLAARDRLIAELVESGARIVDVADVLGFTRKAVYDAIERARER
jgi:hypothetical protein